MVCSLCEQHEDDEKFSCLDVLWRHLSQMKEGDGHFKFLRLAKVAKLGLLIPQSNAAE